MNQKEKDKTGKIIFGLMALISLITLVVMISRGGFPHPPKPGADYWSFEKPNITIVMVFGGILLFSFYVNALIV